MIKKITASPAKLLARPTALVKTNQIKNVKERKEIAL